jgi:hypothetical protein
MDMKAQWTIGIFAVLVIFPFCASSAWREGFTSGDTLQLVGEGYTKGDLPQVQATAMAREAALIEAMSHWPKYCGQQDATQFRIENQKKRVIDCEGGTCRARVIIEKTNLREKCSG